MGGGIFKIIKLKLHLDCIPVLRWEMIGCYSIGAIVANKAKQDIRSNQ